MRKLQIGIVGSAADLQYTKQLESLAFELGQCIASNDCILIYGAEQDTSSLSSRAAAGAKSKSGLSIAITYGKRKQTFDQNDSIIIPTGQERGGGREFAFVLGCDAIIAIQGGSGTLTEIAMAYQANIPIVALQGTGGWSDKLAGTFLDARKRIKIQAVRTPERAVTIAIELAQKNNTK